MNLNNKKYNTPVNLTYNAIFRLTKLVHVYQATKAIEIPTPNRSMYCVIVLMLDYILALALMALILNAYAHYLPYEEHVRKIIMYKITRVYLCNINS